MARWIVRVLDPVERVSEALFGLIMVLTFTGSISVAEAGREEMRTMLVGAIGCNLAWGIVDGVMYLVTTLVARQREEAKPHRRAALTGRDFRGAVETFLLAFLCTFPVVIPFLVFPRNAVRALRVSNAIAITMLFVGGYSLGRYSGLGPFRLGLWMTALGIFLVALTMALGG